MFVKLILLCPKHLNHRVSPLRVGFFYMFDLVMDDCSLFVNSGILVNDRSVCVAL